MGRLSSLALVLLALLAIPSAAAQENEDEEKRELAIVRVDLLDGPEGYPIPNDSIFYPGEKIYLAFNIAGYTFDNDYNMRVNYRISTEGPSGKPFRMAEGGEFAVELAPQDEDWEPLVRFTAPLPPHAGSGRYKIRIEVTDQLANKTVEHQFGVTVEGEDVELSDELLVRSFAFSRTEGGTKLNSPVFRSGDTIWASLYITGYDTREADNTYQVQSDLEVLDSKGKKIYSFDPLEEKGSPFYPRLWLPARFSLKLDKTIPSGEYTIVMHVRDLVGQTEYTHRETFRVQ